MTNANQVAMTLQVMHPQDRLWLLSQLSDTEKATIHERVVDDNGVEVVQAGGFDLAIAREELTLLQTPDVVSRLLSLDASQISQALEPEPDWLAGLVLRAYRWPWHNAVLGSMGPDRKVRILRLRGQDVLPSLVDSVLSNLYERARAVPNKAPAESMRARPLPSLLPRVQHWLRGLVK